LAKNFGPDFGLQARNLISLVTRWAYMSAGREQGCQMVYFQTKNLNLGKFWRALGEKMFVYFMPIWNIL
jgi:hypothetical protein